MMSNVHASQMSAAQGDARSDNVMLCMTHGVPAVDANQHELEVEVQFPRCGMVTTMGYGPQIPSSTPSD